MSEIYNAQYYHNCCGPIPYEEPEHWETFFGCVADQIVGDLKPRTVLDAGCAMGYLVAALRDRGVEAYGVDISEYAISKVREDIRPYCVVASLTEPLPESLPKKYDLVVTIEVLEHLYPEEGAAVIKNLCTLTDKIIFSSTPDDFTERTHVNVQQREYWARLFAENGFLDDLAYRPTYLTYHAACYRRRADWLRQVEDYERNLRMTQAERTAETAKWSKKIEDKERHIQNQSALLSTVTQQREELEKVVADREYQIQTQNDMLAAMRQRQEDMERVAAERGRHIEQMEAAYQVELTSNEELNRKLARGRAAQKALVQDLAREREVKEELNLQLEDIKSAHKQVEGELAHYKEHYFAAINQREELKGQLAQVQNAYAVISNAACWKITKPLRVVLDFIKQKFFANRCMRLIWKGLKCLKENGFRYTWKKFKDKLRHRQDFQTVAARNLYTPQELEAQRSCSFPRKIKISIVVPLYNTPKQFLHEMIQSVLDQTYANWELCMADGSDQEHAYVGRISRSYAQKDKRVIYQKLNANKGISENTNACIDMSTGDYIGLLDHDDLLHPAALYDVMKAICEQDADFIYTDEGIFHKKIEDCFDYHFKSDYAPDTLRSVNYICHFSVFYRQLLDSVGLFDTECDGSQDFDLILRLTEKARKIYHIPSVLYYWRSHPLSTAGDIGSKPYVIQAGHRALEKHLRRIGLQGEVLDTVIPTMYRIRYKIEGNPLVSIIIPNKDHVEELQTCIDSILRISTYRNYEIIIVENNSEKMETFEYYNKIKKLENVQVVFWTDSFNYPAINNYGIAFSQGEHILLLNNDIEVISPSWIEEMLMFSQRKDVGAVGAKLYFQDNTIQHAGVIIGIGSTAGHQHKGANRGDYGYLGRLIYAQNLSAVTGACMMIRRDVWNEIGGLDENFAVAFNDVDICLRIRKAGYLVVWTPYAELYHYESRSRGYEDTPEKMMRFQGEADLLRSRWAKELAAGDPYYNPNLTLDREDFSLR